MTPDPPPEDLERDAAREQAWREWAGHKSWLVEPIAQRTLFFAGFDACYDVLLAKVAELEGAVERLRSAYQDYRQRSERLVWDSIRYGGRTADETIAELARVVTKARRAEAAEARASALEADLAGLRGAVVAARELVATDTPWPFVDAVQLLVMLADEDLGTRDYDRLGWENIQRARDEVKAAIPRIDALAAALDRLATGTGGGEGNDA